MSLFTVRVCFEIERKKREAVRVPLCVCEGSRRGGGRCSSKESVNNKRPVKDADIDHLYASDDA